MTPSAADPAQPTLRERVDHLEEGYEFLLAYAAQGHTRSSAQGKDAEARRHLERSVRALDGIGASIRGLLDAHPTGARMLPFVDVLERDATSAGAAFSLVLAQPVIGSQLIDNLNASSHVRALLTDLFLIDEALEAGAPSE